MAVAEASAPPTGEGKEAMSELHFPNLTIKGFRGIRELTIPRLGRVNLITGKNNTGKSSILEAMRIILNDADPLIIRETLEFREEDVEKRQDKENLDDVEALSQISVLFHGFPQKLKDFSPIIITTTNGVEGEHLEMNVEKISRAFAPYMPSRFASSETQTSEDSDGELLLVVSRGKFTAGHRLRHFMQNLYFPTRAVYYITEDATPTPCILLDPYAGESTNEHSDLWDAVVLTKLESEVVRALRLINSNIAAISMVGTRGSSYERRAVVRAEGIPKPVPLRSFGDGMNRLFGIALSLANAEGGVLLIDEFENGLHYSVQPDVWRMIFQLSKRLNVQVFATTHSKDTVHAFQETAAESEEEAMQIKLRLIGDDNVAVVTDKDELEIATRHDIEVR